MPSLGTNNLLAVHLIVRLIHDSLSRHHGMNRISAVVGHMGSNHVSASSYLTVKKYSLEERQGLVGLPQYGICGTVIREINARTTFNPI